MKKIKLLQLLQLCDSPLQGHLYILPEVLSARLSNCFCKLYMLLCVRLFFFFHLSIYFKDDLFCLHNCMEFHLTVTPLNFSLLKIFIIITVLFLAVLGFCCCALTFFSC